MSSLVNNIDIACDEDILEFVLHPEKGQEWNNDLHQRHKLARAFAFFGVRNDADEIICRILPETIYRYVQQYMQTMNEAPAVIKNLFPFRSIEDPDLVSELRLFRLFLRENQRFLFSVMIQMMRWVSYCFSAQSSFCQRILASGSSLPLPVAFSIGALRSEIENDLTNMQRRLAQEITMMALREMVNLANDGSSGCPCCQRRRQNVESILGTAQKNAPVVVDFTSMECAVCMEEKPVVFASSSSSSSVSVPTDAASVPSVEEEPSPLISFNREVILRNYTSAPPSTPMAPVGPRARDHHPEDENEDEDKNEDEDEEEKEDGEKGGIYQLNCQHFVCVSCTKNIVKRRPVCPLCREKITDIRCVITK